MINFIWKTGDAIKGDLIYRENELSIDFLQKNDNEIVKINLDEFGSLSIGTLQLEVSVKNGKVFFPWGYFPSSQWISRALKPPVAIQGKLFVADTTMLLVGGASELPGSAEWKIYFDRSSGWLLTGREGVGYLAVEFANGVIGLLMNEQLVGLWLKPTCIKV